MSKKIMTAAMAALFVSACASVPMASQEDSSQAKSFAPPPAGQAGLYIYRASGPGTALKKDIWIDDKCVGESAPNVFFFETVTGNQEHTISTESEFSPNSLKLTTASGGLYFVRQYIKMGVFVGGANLEVVSEAEGKKAVQNLEMAVKGTCTQ